MRLHRVKIIGTTGLSDIWIKEGKVAAVVPSGAKTGAGEELEISFDEALAFPGLINAHDHLDFNLFPRLGNRIYQNYTEWGRDIHSADKQTINGILEIPLPLRIKWGIYKNLLNGVTTVINHGKQMDVPDEPVTVLQHAGSLHSPAFERNWKWKINFSFLRKRLLVMHLGEGTDAGTSREIDEVIRWNVLKRKLVAVHGVAMNEKQARNFRALVWCPASNFFLLNKTAPVDLLGKQTDILFGTDSTLTADWNLWEHLRLARNQGMASDEDILGMLTCTPATVWQTRGSGRIAENETADLVIAAPNPGMEEMDNFFALSPEDLLLVVHNGNIRLFDESVSEELRRNGFPFDGFSQIGISNRIKYVWGDLPGLMKQIRQYCRTMEFPVTAW